MPVVQPVLETVYIYIYNGKSVPIDNYEQYKRVINQTNGGLYMHINIYLCVCVVIYNNLLLNHL